MPNLKHSVYVFFDPRYDIGVKVGRGNLANCLHDAQGYAPDGLECAGAWQFATSSQSIAAEKDAHRAMQDNGYERLVSPSTGDHRNGTEWFVSSIQDSVSLLSGLFLSPVINYSIESLRQDKLLSTPRREGRLVLWIFKEELTGRLKLNTCSEFQSPREMRRRYSRNGFSEEAAYVIDPPITLATNQRLYDIRKKITEKFGYGERSQRFGWLSNGVEISNLESEFGSIQELIRISDMQERPLGVRPSYTGQRTHVPVVEKPVFGETWW